MMLTLTACRFGGKTIIQSGRDIYKYSADDDYDDSDDKREKPVGIKLILSIARLLRLNSQTMPTVWDGLQLLCLKDGAFRSDFLRVI